MHTQASGTGGITVARPESWVQAKESQSPTTPEPSASIFPVLLRVQGRAGIERAASEDRGHGSSCRNKVSPKGLRRFSPLGLHRCLHTITEALQGFSHSVI